MIYNDYRTAITTQTTHALLCIVWNAAGLWQIQSGLHAIGPTASYGTIFVLAVMISALHICLFKVWETAYLVLSILVCIMSILAVTQGFIREPSLWPSEFWRYTGIMLNVVGVFGGIIATISFLRNYSIIK